MCGVKRGSDSHWWNPDREYVQYAASFRKKCSNLLHRTLKCLGSKKHKKTSEYLGYTGLELQKWITGNCYWNEIKNKRWHLDHVFPVKAFIDYDIQDLKLINCLENLRPIVAKDNLIKGDKYDRDDFEKWLKNKGIIWQ